MSRYLKLVNFELNRFIKIYLVLAGITIISQIAGVIVRAKDYLNRANEMIFDERIPKETFIEQYGKMSFQDITPTLWFFGPIAICVVTLIIYVFFIWYRDWFGKNTFIYRLLMLPTARINVYLAKASTIFLMVLGLIALQLVLLPIENRLFQWMVPIDFRADMSTSQILQSFPELGMLIPGSFIEFLIYYGLGFMAVFVVFTIILFERSFRWKGILFGIIYGALTVVIFILPILVEEFFLPNFFYPIEYLALFLVMGLIVTAGSIWTSHFLLKKKIRV